MTTLTLEEAHARLPDVLGGMSPGEVVEITADGHPVARVVKVAPRLPRGASDSAAGRAWLAGLSPTPDAPAGPPRRSRRPGICAGMMTIVSDDDDHLAAFAEYMP